MVIPAGEIVETQAIGRGVIARIMAAYTSEGLAISGSICIGCSGLRFVIGITLFSLQTESRRPRTDNSELKTRDLRLISSFPTTLQPTHWIIRVIHRHGLLGDMKRTIRIKHDRHLVGKIDVHAFHDRSRMGTVRNSARMERHTADFDALSRTEFAFNVKQDLIRFDVAVHIRNFDGFRVMIKIPRCESTDYKPAYLESLLIRRWQMQRSRQWFKIPCVESVGIEKTIPANNIERDC